MHSVTQHTWAKLKIYGKRKFYPLISSIFLCKIRTSQVLSSLIIFIWIFLLCLPLVWTWQVRLLSCLRLVRVNVLLSCYGHMLWLHSLLHCGQPSTCGLSHNLYSSRFVLNNLVSFHGHTTTRLYSIYVILVPKGEVCIFYLFIVLILCWTRIPPFWVWCLQFDYFEHWHEPHWKVESIFIFNFLRYFTFNLCVYI